MAAVAQLRTGQPSRAAMARVARGHPRARSKANTARSSQNRGSSRARRRLDPVHAVRWLTSLVDAPDSEVDREQTGRGHVVVDAALFEEPPDGRARQLDRVFPNVRGSSAG